MHDDALEIVRAGAGQFEVLPRVVTPGTIGVGQHLEFQGKGYLGIDLGGEAVVLLLETLRGIVSGHRPCCGMR